MKTLKSKAVAFQTKRAVPNYELRVFREAVGKLHIEVWHMPSPATPHLKHPKYIAGLKGRNLDLIEHRVTKVLKRQNINVDTLPPGDVVPFTLDEETALILGLIFRTLAPMRKREKMRACVEGIEAMGREEAAYWLGMALHRKNPRRVLMALRILLTDLQ
jgi:ribosomal protein S3